MFPVRDRGLAVATFLLVKASVAFDGSYFFKTENSLNDDHQIKISFGCLFFVCSNFSVDLLAKKARLRIYVVEKSIFKRDINSDEATNCRTLKVRKS